VTFVEFKQFIDVVAEQAQAMRAAAVLAGPDAPVLTCPEWTVRDLVAHLARVHGWAGRALLADPDGEAPDRETPPDSWDELLPWWDERRDALLRMLREHGPDSPAWVFAKSQVPSTADFWARRQAHETAIHRLDAEHAASGSAGVDAVPTLVFDSEFAADGIDEALRLLVPRRLKGEPATLTGTVLFHAADAGQAWLAELLPGGDGLAVTAAEPGMDVDGSVVGTADAVYRAVWQRPSTAIRGGDQNVITALKVP
jgi:uncharacterized protein (TIGR03083 family)